jgi:menaquinone-9 beta-reductase
VSVRVAVVGLGTAGAAAARACALAGLDVVGFDRAPLDAAGARWVNGVPRWTFSAGGVPEPQRPELRGAEAPFHLVGGWGPERITLTSALEVDMRHLVARLQRDAREAGAELRGEVLDLRFDGGRLHVDGHPVAADVLVDATGHAGLRTLGQPPLAPADLCTAAQRVHRIADRVGADRFLAAWGAADGEVVCFSGVAGGYSIVNVRIEGDEVGLLTGSLPPQASGGELLRRFVADHPWIGEPLFGGARAIPVRRAWTCVGRGTVALIGDAASQVYPAHGSGVGMQLVAAALLATALASGRGPWAYNVAWQRAYGGLLAASDLFRRFSATLDEADVRALMRRGVLSEGLMGDAMAQRPVRPDPRSVARAAAGLARMPALAVRLGPVLARMSAVEAWYRRYPEDPAALPAWAARLGQVSGIRG